MATFTLTLDDDTLQKLTAAANRIGVAPERLAEVALGALLLNDDDFPGSGQKAVGVREPTRAWGGESKEAGTTGDQLTTSADYAGPLVDLEEALDLFSAELDHRRQRSPG